MIKTKQLTKIYSSGKGISYLTFRVGAGEVFLASYYYEFIVLLFPLIYCAIVTNRLVALHVDRGFMAYLLSPQGVFLLLTATGAAPLRRSFPKRLTLAAPSCSTCSPGCSSAPSAASASSSPACAMSPSTRSPWAPVFLCLLCGGAIGQCRHHVRVLRNLIVFSLFEPDKILAGDPFVLWAGVALTGLTVALYVGGTAVFTRPDLSL